MLDYEKPTTTPNLHLNHAARLRSGHQYPSCAYSQRLQNLYLDVAGSFPSLHFALFDPAMAPVPSIEESVNLHITG